MCQMSWNEIRTRADQVLAQRLDAVRYKMGVSALAATRTPVLGTRGRFFFDTSEITERIDTIRVTLRDELDEVIERANRICEHRFDLLGYANVNYGRAIDWSLDALHGKRAPQKPWFQIRYLSFDEVGDVKVTWELNRHQHLVVLARAYLFTGDERYIRELLAQWYDWRTHNPYPAGINWASSLEVAFRSLSWLWIRHLLSTTSSVPGGFWADLEAGLALHARHIRRFLSTYFSPNTHLLGEAVALFFLGTLCHHGKAGEWASCGWQIILREAERQVNSDGMHFEQSTYYHVYALDFFLHARILAARNGIAIPAHLDAVLKRMLRVLSALGDSGVPPRFGDDDGGRVFDPRRNRPTDLLDPLSVGATLFRREDFATIVPLVTEEAIWLMGPDAAESTRSFSVPAVAPLGNFPSSGIYIAATSSPVLQRMVIDAGPLGSGKAGHGHADALSIHFSAENREWLVDPGAFSYVGPDNQRDRFRGTAAHNTLEIDGLSQAEPDGIFAWRSLPKVRVKRWIRGKCFHFFSAEHDGYSRLPEPIVHQRFILQAVPSLWLIRDRAEGIGVHDFAINWHFAPQISVTLAETCVMARDNEGHQLTILLSNRHWGCALVQGWTSYAYGHKEPGHILRLTQRAAAPVDCAVALLYHKSDANDVGTFETVNTECDRVQMYRRSQNGSYEEIMFGTGGQAWEVQRYGSDAELLYLCASSIENRERLILVGAHYLQIDGETVYTDGDHFPSTFEYCCTRGDEELTLRPDAQFTVEPLRTLFAEMRAVGLPELASVHA